VRIGITIGITCHTCHRCHLEQPTGEGSNLGTGGRITFHSLMYRHRAKDVHKKGAHGRIR
jgi:hypothetical protein